MLLAYETKLREGESSSYRAVCTHCVRFHGTTLGGSAAASYLHYGCLAVRAQEGACDRLGRELFSRSGYVIGGCILQVGFLLNVR